MKFGCGRTTLFALCLLLAQTAKCEEIASQNLEDSIEFEHPSLLTRPGKYALI